MLINNLPNIKFFGNDDIPHLPFRSFGAENPYN
jgi:hypothetical protein